MKPVATIAVGRAPTGCARTAAGVVVANVSGSTLSVIDTAANRAVADIEVGKAPAQVAFSPDGRFVYASVNGEDAVVKVDVATRTLCASHRALRGSPRSVASGQDRGADGRDSLAPNVRVVGNGPKETVDLFDVDAQQLRPGAVGLEPAGCDPPPYCPRVNGQAVSRRLQRLVSTAA
jgi:YVTN family beta-propeller protein